MSKTWIIIKELTGKRKLKSSNPSRKIKVNEVDIFDESKIATESSTFLRKIRSKLASKIPNVSIMFESYVNKPDSIMETKQLLMKKLKDAFSSLKIKKVAVVATSW